MTTSEYEMRAMLERYGRDAPEHYGDLIEAYDDLIIDITLNDVNQSALIALQRN